MQCDGSCSKRRQNVLCNFIPIFCLSNKSFLWYQIWMKRTSNLIQSKTWKPTRGIFITWPPISGRPQSLSGSWSSSDGRTRPLSQSRYLIAADDELASPLVGCLWIMGLNHLVQTRNAKHSAILDEQGPELDYLTSQQIRKNEWMTLRQISPIIYKQIPPPQRTNITCHI